MFALIGLAIVLVSIGAGYAMGGGHFGVLWQPGEFLIIIGSGFGAFFIAYGKAAVAALKALPLIVRGPRYHKKHYVELLCLMYLLFRLAKNKGDMSLEPHIEKPKESAIFQQYPTILKDHEALDFVTAYARLMTLGAKNANEIETIMDAEIDGIAHEKSQWGGAWTFMADGLPALGIVAAVLGVIHTMGSINEPPEVLGHLIGAALVGTFAGVLASYGLFGPIGACIASVANADVEYLRTIKAALLGHMQGYAPQISVEFARKSMPPEARPSFEELDVTLSSLSVPTA